MNSARTVLKNTSILFAAEIMGRAISIAYVAVLARYVHVEGMGQLSTAQAMSGTLLVLVTFGFSQLMIREIAAHPAKAQGLVGNVVFLRLVLALVYGVLIWLSVRSANYSPELAAIVYLYALTAVLGAFVDVASSVFQAYEEMQYLLVVEFGRNVLNVVLSLLAIYLHYSLVVIVAVSAVASLLQLAIATWLVAWRYKFRRIQIDLAWCKRLFVAAIPFAAFSVYYLATYSFNTLILSLNRSSAEVGAFGSAVNLITILMIVPALFMRAVFPVFARLSGRSHDNLKEAYTRSFNYMLILGLGISLGTYVAGDRVLRLIYGSGFEMAMPAVRILAWMPLFSYVGYVNGNLLIATGREKLFMVTEGGFAALTALLGVALVGRYGYLGSCVAILTPTIITFFFYSIFCHRLLGKRPPLRTAASALLAGLLMAAVVYLCLQGGVNLFAVIFLVAPMTYGVALYVLGAVTSDDIGLLRHALQPRRAGVDGKTEATEDLRGEGMPDVVGSKAS
jgi:O-antigen/teichoic acid export membrane protein